MSLAATKPSDPSEARRRIYKRASRERNNAQTALDRMRHWAIRVRMTRATIGQIFLHARTQEALLTYRYLDPIILPIETINEIIARSDTKSIPSEQLYAHFKLEARRWEKKRSPTKNRVWRDKEKEAKEKTAKPKS